MDELVKVVNNEGRQTVLGRDLHEFLEVKTSYTDWFSRMCEYGFVEHVDYSLLKNEKAISGAFSRINHQLTLNMAKELSMLQRTERGKEARQYFIKCEEEFKKLILPQQDSYMIEDPIERAEKWIEEQKEKQLLVGQVEELSNKVEEDKPKVEGYNQFINAKSNQAFKEVAKILGIGRNTMMRILRENNILMKNNTPYQRFMNSNYFIVKDNVQNGYIVPQTFVTPKGIEYIYKILLKCGQVLKIEK